MLPRIATSTTTPDATTVVATLTERDTLWPAVLAGRLGMIPSPTAVTRFGDRYGTTPESLVGAAPFTVTSWTRNSHIALTRGPTFWNPGNPYVATHPELLVEIEREDAEILAAFGSPPGAGLPPSSASENTPVPGGQS